ncbi:MAG: hypothetical protein KJ709_04030 [Nanoarchaeota archaeon]|nr:hypothetical protein [Nanoarchaeota archaeon]
MTDLKALKEKALSDCPADKSFWTCHGAVFRNIYEMLDNIKNQNKDAFRYHVNRDNKKNDYGSWIKDVLTDEELAKRLKRIMKKDRYADIIQQRIKELENVNSTKPLKK